jgi:AraC-like DNA-binding protein
MAQASRLRFARDTSGAAAWQLAFAEPAAPLRRHVLRYCSYTENTGAPMQRRELPFGGIPLIINLGPALRVAHPADRVVWVPQGAGFLAGLHDRSALTETSGSQRGVQIDFSPIGAALFLGRPLRALANAVVDLETLLGPEIRQLIDALAEAAGWTERFALLDRLIARRVLAAAPIGRELAHLWAALEASAGTIEIGRLAAEIGWSRKHLIQRFTNQFGLPPKRTARILRFNHAIGLLRQGRVESWSALAQDCGFYDQAHMIRDFHRFAGSAPAEFLARQLPDHGGLRGD